MKVVRALGAAALLVSGVASAQDREADAERLFREGQKLLEERRYGEACPKFEAAYEKDGQLGTLINLAFCHKEQGATWYAWLEFREAEVKATALGRKDRTQFVQKQLALLAKNLPTVIVDNPNDEPLVEVLVEDRRVPEAELGAPFAAEAGERKITFRARGKKPAVLLVEVAPPGRRKSVQRVAVPPLEEADPEPVAAEPSPAAPIADPGPDPGPGGGGETAAPGAAPGGATQRTLGYVALGVGGAGLVAGSIFGLLTFTNPCGSLGDRDRCTAAARDDADRTGMVSNVAFAVGGVGLVAGALLLFTAPKAGSSAGQGATAARSLRARVMPEIGAGWAGVRGAF
jgi:hypothetical protein